MSSGRDAKLRAQALAMRQGGVLGRDQARTLGVTPDMIRVEIRAGRWCRAGSHCIAVTGFPVTAQARWRVALAHSGPSAALDGVTALEAAGLKRFTDTMTHISAPEGGHIARFDYVTRHFLRCRRPDDVMKPRAGSGELPYVRPALATTRAGLWARSDRACATVMCMAVQQGIATPVGVQLASASLPRHARSVLVRQVAKDIVDGVSALSEWEFTQLCRQHGVPEPDRQVRRKRPGGAMYLDVRWAASRLVVEIDGIQHFAAENQIDDSLRHNDIALTRDTVLRVPLIGLRVVPQLYLAQIRRGLQL